MRISRTRVLLTPEEVMKCCDVWPAFSSRISISGLALEDPFWMDAAQDRTDARLLSTSKKWLCSGTRVRISRADGVRPSCRRFLEEDKRTAGVGVAQPSVLTSAE